MKTNVKGFTLIEILIAMTIMATLTVLTSQSIQQALVSKVKIQSTIDDMSQVRDALKIIEKDVNLAYHYRDLEKEFKEEVKKQATIKPTTPPPPNQPPPQPTPPENTQFRIDPTTHFIGGEDQMAFITMNTGRLNENDVQADFIKVGYALKPCRKLKDGESSGCLLRRSSSLSEGDVLLGGEETVLLQDVSEFKLRYIGKGKQDWNTSWSSKVADASTQGNFPEMVEISLTVEKGAEKKKKISMQIIASIHFPNNSTERNRGTITNQPGFPTQPPGGSQ